MKQEDTTHFFEFEGSVFIDLSNVTIEDLYQHFKNRLMLELKQSDLED